MKNRAAGGTLPPLQGTAVPKQGLLDEHSDCYSCGISRRFRLTKAVLPYMIEQGGGHIVVISSLTGKLPVPGRSAYSASKHALHGFFDALRGEVHQYNIKVTLVCPGFVRTHISENALLPDGSVRGGKPDANHRAAMSPEESAKHILHAIRTGKEEYDYGGKERFVVPIRRLFPWLYSRAIRRVRLSP